MTIQSTPVHPVLACAAAMDEALKDVAGVDPLFMQTPDKQSALTALTQVASRVEELRLRVLAGAEDVAVDAATRDVAAWLAHTAHLDGASTRRDLRLARALDVRWHLVAAGLAEGRVNRAQADVVVAALHELPDDLDPEIVGRAEERLVELCATFGPRQLRILGRRVLDVVAPDVADDEERKALERDEAQAATRSFLTTRRRGDGTTDVRIRLSDAAAGRLLTYLEAFTSPRRTPGAGGERAGETVHDRRPYDQRLGHAFVAFLESVDPKRMPLHGGDATTVVVTIDLDDLVEGLGIGLIGDEPITAEHVRRLACTASVIPAVLGGEGEILDLGRSRRLFSPAQRKAMAVRDRRCRAEGCDIPAAWCEAHHVTHPWSRGGLTDLADGVLLCSWHHHRAHDHRYDNRRLPSGDVRFSRRT